MLHGGGMEHILVGNPRQLFDGIDDRGESGAYDESSEGIVREGSGLAQHSLFFTYSLPVVAYDNTVLIFTCS